MRPRSIQFLAIALTALALVPSGTHFFELPNKIGLPRDHHFIVQQIYRGWSGFGAVLFGAIGADLALAIVLVGRRPAFWFAMLGFALEAATLAIFLTWTYPANQATLNWTAASHAWQQLRAQWEYSHATDAILTFGALCSVTLAALK